jgi:hypothetical protein
MGSISIADVFANTMEKIMAKERILPIMFLSSAYLKRSYIRKSLLVKETCRRIQDTYILPLLDINTVMSVAFELNGFDLQSLYGQRISQDTP